MGRAKIEYNSLVDAIEVFCGCLVFIARGRQVKVMRLLVFAAVRSPEKCTPRHPFRVFLSA